MSKVLAILATFVVALFGAHIARADADFTDPASDANGAPDVTDVSVFAEMNEAYASYFPSDPPARTTIGVAALPLGAEVEMDAIIAL